MATALYIFRIADTTALWTQGQADTTNFTLVSKQAATILSLKKARRDAAALAQS